MTTQASRIIENVAQLHYEAASRAIVENAVIGYNGPPTVQVPKAVFDKLALNDVEERKVPNTDHIRRWGTLITAAGAVTISTLHEEQEGVWS